MTTTAKDMMTTTPDRIQTAALCLSGLLAWSSSTIATNIFAHDPISYRCVETIPWIVHLAAFYDICRQHDVVLMMLQLLLRWFPLPEGATGLQEPRKQVRDSQMPCSWMDEGKQEVQEHIVVPEDCPKSDNDDAQSLVESVSSTLTEWFPLQPMHKTDLDHETEQEDIQSTDGNSSASSRESLSSSVSSNDSISSWIEQCQSDMTTTTTSTTTTTTTSNKDTNPEPKLDSPKRKSVRTSLLEELEQAESSEESNDDSDSSSEQDHDPAAVTSSFSNLLEPKAKNHGCEVSSIGSRVEMEFDTFEKEYWKEKFGESWEERLGQ